MDLISLMGVVFRRWRVTVPILLLTLGIAVAVQQSTDPVYEAKGSVVVAAPQTNPATAPANVADPAVIARAVRSSEEAAALTSGGSGVQFTFDSGLEELLQIVVTGQNPEAVRQAADTLVNLSVELVQARQVDAGIAEVERIQAVPVPDGTRITETDPDGDDVPTYTITTDVVFEDPAEGVENPYSASPVTARLLEVATQSDAGRQQVAARTSGEIEYSVVQNENDRAPILEVITSAPTREQALSGFEEVVEVVAEELDRLQERAGVLPSRRLSIEVLAAPQTVRDVSPPISRAVAVTVALGFLLALAGALLAENLAVRRQRREPSVDDPHWRPGQDTDGGDQHAPSANGSSDRSEATPRLGPPST